MTNTRSARNMADDLNRGRARTKTTSQGFMALCPNHADKNPSLSIRETEGGRILLKCFATTCTDQRQVYDAVERALNLDPGALGGPGDGYVPAVAQDRVKNVRPAFEAIRSEEHTSELQSLMRISYAVFCLKKKHKIT